MNEVALVALANIGCSLALENEFRGGGLWVKIAPYGESLNEQETASGRDSYLQQLDYSAAVEMASKFNTRGKFSLGVPIFKGHPDLIDHAPQNLAARLSNDKRPCGMIAALEARTDGLYGQAVMTDEGVTAVDDGLKWFSPFWKARIVGNRNAAKLARPFSLISIGLTDAPNIQGGEALANSGFNEQTRTTKRNEMITVSRRFEELGYTAVKGRCPDLLTLVIASGRPAQPVSLANSAAGSASADKATNEMDKLCREFMKERNVDWNRAWSEMSRKHPELIQAMHQTSGTHPRARAAGLLPPGFSSESLQNNAGMAAAMAAAPPMVTGPGAALLGLWPGVDQDIFNVAFRANGNRMPGGDAGMDAAKVFEAIVNHIANRDGISIEDAIAVAKQKADWLWKKVQAAAR